MPLRTRTAAFLAVNLALLLPLVTSAERTVQPAASPQAPPVPAFVPRSGFRILGSR